MLGDTRNPQFFYKKVVINIKIDIMGVRNIKFLVGENWIPCFKINGSVNDFMGNLYDHGLPIFGH